MRNFFIVLFLLGCFTIPAFSQVDEGDNTGDETNTENVKEDIRKNILDSLDKIKKKAEKETKKEVTKKTDADSDSVVTKKEAATRTKPAEKVNHDSDSLSYYRNAYHEATTPKYPPGVIYGQDFFRNGNFKFYQKAEDARVPENYTIGPGDEIGIQVYGFSDFKGTFKVGSDGAIYAKDLGKIFLKGLTFEQAKRVIRQQLGATYNTENSGVEVTLNYSRTILVHISGEVFKPGSYVIPAINSAFNALVAVGGPTDIGSVRNIYIKRDGKIVDTVDAYDILFNPAKSREIFLQSNDYIIVPVANKTVRIEGTIRKPNLYELKAYENLNDLIFYGGGLMNNTYTKSILVKRVAGDKIIDISVNYDSLHTRGKDFPLQAGDVVTIRQYTTTQYNLITINGAVVVPGEYEWKANLHASDLIKTAGGLLQNAYLPKAYVLRSNPNLTVTYIPFNVQNALADERSIDNLLLEKKDIIYISNLTDFYDPYNVTIAGEVRKPGTFSMGNKLRLSDIVFMAGGLKAEAYMDKAVIIRTNDDLTKTTLSVNLRNALADTAGADNIYLYKKDVITIFNFASFLETYNFTIQGPVRKPGVFEYASNTRISDLILLAGGLKTDEYVKELVQVTRVNPEDFSLTYERFNLENILRNPTSEDNIILQRGDLVRILNKRDFIQDYKVAIYGSVKNPGSFPFGYKLTLRDVLLMAGGFTAEAENGRIEISRIMNISPVSGLPEPVKHIVDTFHIERDLRINATSGVFELMPFDEIFIRSKREFARQRHVVLAGEVAYPGIYAIGEKNTKITEVLKRAGGTTYYALEKGATLHRTKDNPGEVYFNLKRAVKRPWTHFNYYLEDGDSIYIPRTTDLIFLTGYMKFENKVRFQNDTIANVSDKSGSVNVPYIYGRRAGYYIHQFTGGFSKVAMKRKTVVVTADGKVRHTINLLLFKIYPRVSLGSKIVVKPNPRKVERQELHKLKHEKKKRSFDPLTKTSKAITDANEFYKKTMDRITQVLSIVLLAKTAFK